MQQDSVLEAAAPDVGARKSPHALIPTELFVQFWQFCRLTEGASTGLGRQTQGCPTKTASVLKESTAFSELFSQW